MTTAQPPYGLNPDKIHDVFPRTYGSPVHLGHVVFSGCEAIANQLLDYLVPQIGGRVDSLTACLADWEFETHSEFVRKCVDAGVCVSVGKTMPEDHYDLFLPNPWLPPHDPLFLDGVAKCDEVLSDYEFARRESDSDSVWIGITGTNGKTTTTLLLAEMLRASGKTVVPCGNVGFPSPEGSEIIYTCVKALMEARRIYAETGKHAVIFYDVEVCSYHAEIFHKMELDAGCYLNLTPDHLPWHETMERYGNAKWRVYEAVKRRAITRLEARTQRRDSNLPKPLFVYEVDGDPLRDARLHQLAIDMNRYNGAFDVFAYDRDNCIYDESDGVYSVSFSKSGEQHDLGAIDNPSLWGLHNVENVIMSAVMASHFDVTDDEIKTALKTYKAPEHRCEDVAVIDGVRYINDVKSTNPDATIKVLDRFKEEPIVLMLGGGGKDLDMTEVCTLALETAKRIECFGTYGPTLMDVLEDLMSSGNAPRVPVEYHKKLRDAFDNVAGHAEDGDIVLLSPACSGVDEYKNYGDVGDAFKAMVHEVEEK